MGGRAGADGKESLPLKREARRGNLHPGVRFRTSGRRQGASRRSTEGETRDEEAVRDAAARLPACRAAPPPVPPSQIDVLSNRADLISAGDALVEVKLPAGTDPASVVVTDDGRDVSSAFALNADGRFLGLVEGLDLGDNVLTATLPDGSGARITIVNHPNGGPVFSGPQVQPWVCQETRGRRAVQPARRLRVPVQERERRSSRRTTRRTRRPTSPRRRPTRARGALHRARRDRLPGPRPVPDRGPLRPVEAVHRGRARRTASTTSS